MKYRELTLYAVKNPDKVVTMPLSYKELSALRTNIDQLLSPRKYGRGRVPEVHTWNIPDMSRIEVLAKELTEMHKKVEPAKSKGRTGGRGKRGRGDNSMTFWENRNFRH